MPIPQSSEQYSRIPANLRQRLLELYGNINPVVTGITLAPHGFKSKTWRLRWRTPDGQYSLSIGSVPQVIEAVRNLLAEWKSDGIAFLLSEFGNEGQIPYQYLGRIELMRRHREEEQRQPHYIHRTMRPYVPMPMDETTRQRLRELPQALLDQLLGLHKLIKVVGKPMWSMKAMFLASVLVSFVCASCFAGDFFSIVESGTLKQVQDAIKQGANVKETKIGERTPLHVAAMKNKSPDVIGALVKAGAEVNAKDFQGVSPLELAARENTALVVKALIKSKADINVNNSAPLHLAVMFNPNLDVIPTLMTSGADVTNILDPIVRECSRPEALAAVIKGGAKVTAIIPPHDMTYLHVAARHNKNSDIISVLVKAGCKVSAKEKQFENTPLHVAAMYNPNPDVCAALIKAGASVKETKKDAETALTCAAFGNENPKVLETLIKLGADVNALDAFGNPPLFAACSNIQRENPAFAEALLKAGANINATDVEGETVIHVASRFCRKSPKILEVLIKAGADINKKDAQGNSPLKLSKQDQRCEVAVKVLEAAGAKE